MDLLARVWDGFQSIEVDDAVKGRALGHLEQWLADPGFAGYRPQLEWLVRTGQWAGLLDRFCQVMPFGTGGRRGPVGIGPNRMNLWSLGASVQGHSEYLKERFPGLEPLRVVLGYDVRRFEDARRQYNPDLPNPVLHLSSRDFARRAACVYAANGIQALIPAPDSRRYLATPELSFTIRHLGCHGGLNISASHNPPDDNGGKFYDEHGGQPVPPDDQIMADLVDQVTTIKAFPWPEAFHSGRVGFLDDVPHRAYISLCCRQSLVPPPRVDELQVVYTPLHGVGSTTALEALTAAGFRVTPVDEQMQPDGGFPHVTGTPNPEVPQSMDRAAALARAIGADLVLATDPDADRVGAMIPTSRDEGGRMEEESSTATPQLHPSSFILHPSNGWRFVTGNEIAALLTHFKLAQLARQNRLPPSPIVVKSLVTSTLITRIARKFGAQVVDNLLVGFKYMAEVLRQLEDIGAYEDVRATPEDWVIGCEESHGILVTPQIRDKDAGGAALLLAELALDQKRQGRTVLDYLADIARQFGYFRNELRPVIMRGVLGQRDMARVLERLRASPPREIGGLAVTGLEDLRDERGRLGPIKGATDRAARNVLVFCLGERGRVALRPSGTEPKAKAYIEIWSPPCPAGASPGDWQRACREVDEATSRVAAAFLQLVGTPKE